MKAESQTNKKMARLPINLEAEQAQTNFYETAMAAGEHYRKTGLHTTHEEMKAWVKSLGSARELTPPTCHK